MKKIRRRDFMRYAGAGIATIIVGCNGKGGGDAPAGPGGNDDGTGGGGIDDGGNGDDTGGLGTPVETLNFTITDAIKEMITHEPDNPAAGPAECYFWVYKEDRFPADNPGPQIYAVSGDVIRLNVTNALDSPHAFTIPGPSADDPPMVDTGPIPPGESVSVDFVAGAPGTYLYHDNLNAPVNRVMGLHGAFVVMPAQAAEGHNFTPYANPSASVQQLFDDLGNQVWYPGLSWETGDEQTETPPFRQHVWLAHQASPVLFEEVGLFARNNPGQDYPADEFIRAFVADPFINTSNDPRTLETPALPKTSEFNRKPHFFTLNGQSGFFSHHNPTINPFYRVGEPTVVRVLNAGLWSHAFHLHANHYYVTAVENVPEENIIWYDTFSIMPMRCVDFTIPFTRPPDVPNERGIGRADRPLTTLNGGPTWPPREELERHHPNLQDSVVTSFDGSEEIDLAVTQSPLCYPMHDHTEPTQTAQGANYICGLIAGIYIIGDRNEENAMNFPLEGEFEQMLDIGRQSGETGPAVGDFPPED